MNPLKKGYLPVTLTTTGDYSSYTFNSTKPLLPSDKVQLTKDGQGVEPYDGKGKYYGLVMDLNTRRFDDEGNLLPNRLVTVLNKADRVAFWVGEDFKDSEAGTLLKPTAEGWEEAKAGDLAYAEIISIQEGVIKTFVDEEEESINYYAVIGSFFYPPIPASGSVLRQASPAQSQTIDEKTLKANLKKEILEELKAELKTNQIQGTNEVTTPPKSTKKGENQEGDKQ